MKRIGFGIFVGVLIVIYFSPMTTEGRAKKPASQPLPIEKKEPSKWKYEKSSFLTFEGTIKQIYEIQQAEQTVTTICALVRSGAVVYSVHLGPTWYIKSEGFEIVEDLLVTVSGSRIVFEGELSVIASEIIINEKKLKLRDPENGFPLWFEPDQPTSNYNYCLDS